MSGGLVLYPTTYFPANYFALAYFVRTRPGPDDVEPPVANYGDDEAFQAIISALRATNGFGSVTLALPNGGVTRCVDPYPSAVVTPIEWHEVEDTVAQSVNHHVTYQLTLAVRGGRCDERFSRLDRLSALAHDALNGSDLGGGCVPASSRVHRGRFDPKGRPPEARVILTGTFSYPVPAVNARSGSS